MILSRRIVKQEKRIRDAFALDPFGTLREKWGEIPSSAQGRSHSTKLLALSDTDLLTFWRATREEITTDEQFAHRGWLHLLYRPMVVGKTILDLGSGLAIDSLTFAESGAHVTFVDVVESNLKVVHRLVDLLRLPQQDFLYLDSLDGLRKLAVDFDVILAAGSLHHAPEEFIRQEVSELIRHLKTGGRWLQLAYPRSRWEQAGRPSFAKWGEMTDGKGTPWAEWYDLPKLLSVMSPAKMEPVFCLEFYRRQFIWFDLVKRS